MALPDIYRALFGKDHPTDGDVISLSEHGRVGGLSTGQAFKHAVIIDKDNGSYLGINNGSIQTYANGNVISTNNASTTPLGGNATYTGTSDDITDYISITISVVVDQSGTLYIDFSQDNTNWDHIQTYPITITSAGTAEGFSFQAMKEARYFRLRYTNGATIQGIFRLQVILNQVIVAGEVHQINQPIIAQTDAMVTKGVIYGATTAGGGSYVAVKVTPSGAINTSGVINDGTDDISILAAGADATANTENELVTAGFMYGYNGTTWDRLRATTTGLYTQIRDAAGNARGANVNASNQLSVSVDNIPTADVEIDGTALSNSQTTIISAETTIVTLSEGRRGVILANQGSVDCYIGTTGVTTANGFLLRAGESVAIETDDTVKGITSASTTTIGALILN